MFLDLSWKGWLAAGVALAAGGGGGIVYWRRRLTPQERERQRHAWLKQRGRMSTAKIIDVIPATPANPKPARRNPPVAADTLILVYQYEIAGVEYESSQTISEAEAARLLPGMTVVIRYDARNPGNCILTAETNSAASR